MFYIRSSRGSNNPVITFLEAIPAATFRLVLHRMVD